MHNELLDLDRWPLSHGIGLIDTGLPLLLYVRSSTLTPIQKYQLPSASFAAVNTALLIFRVVGSNILPGIPGPNTVLQMFSTSSYVHPSLSGHPNISMK